MCDESSSRFGRLANTALEPAAPSTLLLLGTMCAGAQRQIVRLPQLRRCARLLSSSISVGKCRVARDPRGAASTAKLASFDYPVSVSPTVLRVKGFRSYFFSREEPRAHVHVQHAEGEAAIELHANYGLKAKRLAEAQKLVEEHGNEIRSAWKKHFRG